MNLSVIQAARARYGPLMTNNECVELLNRIAWENPGWGLLSKPGGNNGQRTDGVLCSIDYLVRQSDYAGFDVLQNAGGNGPSAPQWSDNPSDQFDQTRFVKPILPVGSIPDPIPGPVPTPPPPPPDPSLSIILDLLNAIQRRQVEDGLAVQKQLAELKGWMSMIQEDMDYLQAIAVVERPITLNAKFLGTIRGKMEEI